MIHLVGVADQMVVLSFSVDPLIGLAQFDENKSDIQKIDCCVKILQLKYSEKGRMKI